MLTHFLLECWCIWLFSSLIHFHLDHSWNITPPSAFKCLLRNVLECLWTDEIKSIKKDVLKYLHTDVLKYLQADLQKFLQTDGLKYLQADVLKCTKDPKLGQNQHIPKKGQIYLLGEKIQNIYMKEIQNVSLFMLYYVTICACNCHLIILYVVVMLWSLWINISLSKYLQTVILKYLQADVIKYLHTDVSTCL